MEYDLAYRVSVQKNELEPNLICLRLLAFLLSMLQLEQEALIFPLLNEDGEGRCFRVGVKFRDRLCNAIRIGVPNPTLLHLGASAATPLPCFCYAIALQK